MSWGKKSGGKSRDDQYREVMRKHNEKTRSERERKNREDLAKGAQRIRDELKKKGK